MLLVPKTATLGERLVPHIPTDSLLIEVTSVPCDEETIIIVFDYLFLTKPSITAIELYTNYNLETPFALVISRQDPPNLAAYVDEAGELATYSSEEELFDEYPEGLCDLVLEDEQDA